MDRKTGSHRALRARAGSRRARRGCPVLQEPVLGATDGKRRNSLSVLGVLSEVPEPSISGPPQGEHFNGSGKLQNVRYWSNSGH